MSTTTDTSPPKSHPYIHTTKLLQGLTGINLTRNENPRDDYEAVISSISHLGDPPEGTRSDIKSLSKVLNLHVGDVLVKINEMSLYQVSFSNVVLLSKRQGTECVLTVASDRRHTIGTIETTNRTKSTLKEPKTTKYRITKSYGYMQFDFKEFSEFFRNGSDAPLKSLRADWNRAKYFLNGQREHSMDVWVETCCNGWLDRGKSDEMVIRMCKYRSMP